MNTPPWRTVFAGGTRRRLTYIPKFSWAYRRPYSVGVSPPPSKSDFLSKTKTFAKYGGLFLLSSGIGLVTLGIGILVHDAFSYNDKHVDRVPVNPLALHPERGGPKNLPIARVLVDDEEDDDAKSLSSKPKLVIIGAGWGVCLITFYSETCPNYPSPRPWVYSNVYTLETIMSLSYPQRLSPLSRRFFLVSNHDLEQW